MVPDQGVVQGCGRPCSAARLGYPQSDHGGEGGFLQPRIASGDKHPHLSAAVPVGRLGAYRGQDIVGGGATTQSSLRGGRRG